MPRQTAVYVGVLAGGLILAGLMLGAGTAHAIGPGGHSKPKPLEILQSAFDRMFNYPSVRAAEFSVFRGGRLVSYRAFDVAYQKIEGRGHTILRFTAPEYLRGNALLLLEKDARTDAWLYQPEERKLRRVSTQQKRDSFYGTDFTFEDMEHHDWNRFALNRLPDTHYEENDCIVIEALAPDDSQYSKIVVFVEKKRLAVTRVDFFRGSSSEPHKQMLVDRIESIADGLLIPREVRVIQRGRDAHTAVKLTRVEVDPTLTQEAFSTLRLQREGSDLFDLVNQKAQKGPQ